MTSIARPLALLLAFACLAAACSPPAGEPEADDVPGRVIELAVADDPTISFSISFLAGSQYDPPGKQGLAALTGAMLAEGATTRNSYEKILEALYPLASSYDIRVDKEIATLTGRTHRDNLDTFFELFTDAYLQPAFKQEDFERLKADQRNSIETTLRYSQDEILGKAALTHFVFEGTPYAHPVEGTVKGIEAITLEDVRGFYQQHYRGEGAVPALGGGYPADLVARFEATLERLPAGAAPTPPAVEPPAIEGFEVLLVEKDDADASISFGFPIEVTRGEDEFYALWVANSWLGEHRNSSSHLYDVIREKRGLNYGDYSYIEFFPEGPFRQMPPPNAPRREQMFEVWIRTLPNEQAVFAIRAALRELEDLVEGGMSEEEFELTRSFLSSYVLNFATNTQVRLGYKVDDFFYGVGGEGHLARFRERMGELTREQVNAAIKKHLQLGNVKFAIVTGDAEGLTKTLVENAPSPITYATEKSAEIQEEDRAIASFPVEVAAEDVRTVAVDEIFGE